MIKYTIVKHASAFPSKVKATQCGHIYNITITEDVDNGWFIGKSSQWAEYDRYTEVAPTSITGLVQGEAANGNMYVEITEAPVNCYFVYTVPMIEEEFSHAFTDEQNFYNAGADATTGRPADTVRAYELCVGDVIEISANGFAGTVAAGDTVSLKAISGKTAMQLGK